MVVLSCCVTVFSLPKPWTLLLIWGLLQNHINAVLWDKAVWSDQEHFPGFQAWYYYPNQLHTINSLCIVCVMSWFITSWVCPNQFHDDVIKWKRFLVTGPLCREFTLHRQIPGALIFSLICTWKKTFSKQSRHLWFETPSRSLWRHCNVSFYWSSHDCSNSSRFALNNTGMDIWKWVIIIK